MEEVEDIFFFGGGGRVSPKIAKVILWRLLDVEEQEGIGKEEMRNEYLVK